MDKLFILIIIFTLLSCKLDSVSVDNKISIPENKNSEIDDDLDLDFDFGDDKDLSMVKNPHCDSKKSKKHLKALKDSDANEAGEFLTKENLKDPKVKYS